MGKRTLSVFLCLVMVLSMVPQQAFANTRQEDTGLCAHHTVHEGCGYVEAVAGSECTHVCGEGCPTKQVTACVHDHAALGCTWVEAVEAAYCGHTCGDGSCAYTPGVAGVDCTCQPAVTHSEGCASLGEGMCDCTPTQTHQDTCAPVAAVAEVPCDFVHTGCGCAEAVAAHWSCSHVCSGDSGCVKSVCAHVCPGDDCGYVAAVEGKPCTYECTECAKGVCTGTAECSAETHNDGCLKKAAQDQAAADKAAADAVAALIQALPTLEQIKAKPLEEQSGDYNQVQAAYTAYQALTEAQKALLPPAEETFLLYFDYFNTLTQPAADGAISTKEQLNAIRNDLDGDYYLTCDIVFTEADFAQGGAFYNNGKLWIPIGSETETFTGTLDGKGYAIKGLKIDCSGNTEPKVFAGLFANCSGQVSNLTLEGGSVVADAKNYNYVGSFAGQAIDGVFTNCVNKNTITVTGSNYWDYVGGLVGRVDTKNGNPGFYNCKNQGNITYTGLGGYGGYVAGIVGSFYNKNSVMEECTNTGNLNVKLGYDSRVGGLAAASNSTVRSCTNSGNIYVEGDYLAYLGGLVGVNSGFVTDCSNSGTVSAATGAVYMGGIVGENYYFRDYNQMATVSGCVNTGTVNLETTITRNSNSRFRVGGVAGDNACQLLQCYNTGSVISRTNADSTAYSNYTYHYTGGVVGLNTARSGVSGTVSSCYNAGPVSAITNVEIVTDFYTGGVVGDNEASTVKDTYNAGSVSVSVSPKYVPYVHTGGIVGNNETDENGAATLATSYNVGSISVNVGYSTSGTYTGGSVGVNTGTVTDCYQLNNIATGIGSGSGEATSATESQMLQQSTFQNFDFTDVWTMEGNTTYLYPELMGMSMVGSFKTITGITVSTLPTKTSYYVNEQLNVSGGKVRVSFSDGTTSVIDMTSAMVSGFSSSSTGNQTLTVSYGGKTTTFTVTVVNPTVTDITISTKPQKLVYNKGETLSVTGGKLRVNYSDGTSITVDMTTSMVSGFSTETAGNKTLTVTYDGMTTTYTISVNANYVASVTAGGVTKQYESLEEAFAEANQAAQAEISLLQGVSGPQTGNVALPVTGSITLKLNGFTITNKLIDVAEGAKLTIQDSSATPGGIAQTGNYSTYFSNSGTVILQGGSITCGVDNGGTMTITGGSVSGKGSGAIQNNGKLTVSGGSVTGGSVGIYNMGTLQVSGGSVSSQKGIVNANSGTVTIAAGSVTGTAGAAIQTDGKLTVTGGSISGNSVDIDYFDKTSSAGSLSGGTFSDGLKLQDSTLQAVLAEGEGYYVGGNYVKVTSSTAVSLPGPVTVKAADESKFQVSIDRNTYKEGYPSLDAAFGAASDGAQLKLEQNTTAANAKLTDAGSYTLDLGGKELSGKITVGKNVTLTVTASGTLLADILVQGELTVPAGTDFSRITGEEGAKLTVGENTLVWDSTLRCWICENSHSWKLSDSGVSCPICGSTMTLEISVANTVYNGKAQEPALTVKVNGSEAVKGTDYTLVYENNTDAGTGKVTVTGAGSYSGSVVREFTISPCQVTVTVAPMGKQLYTGAGVKPDPALTFTGVPAGLNLVSGRDYTLTYSNNTAVGEATLTVSPVDGSNYTFTETDTSFTIAYGVALPDVTGTVYVDGIAKQVEDGILWLEDENAKLVTTYDLANPGAEDLHTVYPTAMYVWELNFTSESGYSAGRLTELDNALQYSGTSIRITGNQGIRFITSVPTAKKSALAGSGLAGYKLVEYGTLMGWYTPGNELLYGVNAKSIAYDRTSGTDQVFNSTGDLIQFTGMLTDLELEQSTKDLMTRPYMVLERTNAAGETEQVVLYGGSIVRSIGYVAYQNKDVFPAGTSSYEFIWNILSYAYPDLYEQEYQG